MPPDVERLLKHETRDRAFAVVVDYYQTKVFRLVYSIVRNGAAAEDVTQDVFVKVWQVLDSYNPRWVFGTWLYTIARNSALNQLRHESYRRAEPLDAVEEPAAQRSAESLEIAQLRRMVDQLPSEQREVVVQF